MTEYKPGRWLVVKINSKEPHYRVFATWGGGYLNGDEWKLNSGITKVSLIDDHYHFEGSSGSVYICRKTSYGSTGYGWGVLDRLTTSFVKEDMGSLEVLDENIDFLALDYACDIHNDKGYQVGTLADADAFAEQRKKSWKITD
jgi:hypothetical protein